MNRLKSNNVFRLGFMLSLACVYIVFSTNSHVLAADCPCVNPEVSCDTCGWVGGGPGRESVNVECSGEAGYFPHCFYTELSEYDCDWNPDEGSNTDCGLQVGCLDGCGECVTSPDDCLMANEILGDECPG